MKLKILEIQCATCRYEFYEWWELPCSRCLVSSEWQLPIVPEKLNPIEEEDCNCD